MKALEIHFRTLTPIWTGGAERNSNRPRETGLMGSLRWWYAGVMRGLDGHACDPVGDGRCEYDVKDKRPPEEQLCPACYLFGCTGWGRRFRLEAEGLKAQDLFFVASSGVYQAAGNWLWRIFGGKELGGTRQGRGGAVAFTFGVQALWGEQATLHVVHLRGDAQGTLARVAFLLDTVVRWGGLGAKPQHGFGQIQIADGLDLAQEGPNLITTDIQRYGKKPPPPADLFSLGSFFSHTYELAQAERYLANLREIGTPPPSFDYRQHFIPCAFDIRYKSRSKDFRTGQGQNFGMRPWFREKWGTQVAHRLFGRSDARRDEDRSAGRIHVSHLFWRDDAWHLKVWGHVPPDLKDENGNPISVGDVAGQATAYVGAMFPGSQLVDEFNREEMLRQ
jgi:CRISPR-associated protein Cmr1